MYECFECGERSVVWDADFDYADYGFDEKGIVHECHCSKCGAKILYFCPDEPEEDDET